MFDLLNEYAAEKEKKERREAAEDGSGYSANAYSANAYAGSASKILVLSLGGSLFFDEKPNVQKIAKFCEVLSRLHLQGHKFVLVVGGGKPARHYVSGLKAMGANNFVQDELGIRITRANACFFIAGIEKTHKKVLKDPMKALSLLEKGLIPVFGGILPSFTTDAVSALVAEAVGGEFVNLTDVDGVYSSDPKKNPHAKFYPEMSYETLLSMIKLSQSKPGQNLVLDLPCVNILRRSNLRGIVLNGNDLANFEAFVNGQEFKGTVIQQPQMQEHIVDD